LSLEQTLLRENALPTVSTLGDPESVLVAGEEVVRRWRGAHQLQACLEPAVAQSEGHVYLRYGPAVWPQA